MDNLIQGVSKFMNSAYEEKQDLFSSLADGQSPGAFFVTCSDSRVDPHLITRSEPGDLFVLRNAGNFIPQREDSGESATVEYAASVLGVEDIVVCGHSDCGAVKALLDPPESGALPSIEVWLRQGNEVLEIVENHEEWTGQERIDRGIEINVLVQIKRMSEHPAVAALLEKGAVRLHAWVYDIGSGQVRAFDAATGEFAPLKQEAPFIESSDLQDLPFIT